MSRSDPRPPAVSGRLLAWAAHRLGTPELVHDAAELFVDKFHRHGERRARRWHRRQALAALFRLLLPGRNAVREGRSLALSGLSLDLKLGCRLWVKHPGLTLIGGLALTVAVAIGATWFSITTAMFHSKLPFEEGERVVAIENWDAAVSSVEEQVMHDFAVWREELDSVEDVGAWRTIGRNLIVPGGSAKPVTVVKMTTSGFRLARVPPLLGRTLVEEDEQREAPPVAVIGYDMWQNGFGGDPGVVGREIRLGSTVYTVVGVMPEEFGFPGNHQLWVPFRTDPSDWERRKGPEISVFGRLAPGATLERAQTELATIGRQAAAAFPETHQQLRPRIVPYTLQYLGDLEGSEFRLVQFLIILLLLVICVNIAVLVYARTAVRLGEITVRSALGASRRRIVAQLFAEALVLSLAAAAVGLAVAGLVLSWLEVYTEEVGSLLPFWMDLGLSPGTVFYVVGLTMLAAAVVGVAPALKATGHRLQSGLRQLSGGATGMRLGRIWTVLIVAQVAFAVAVLPWSGFHGWNWARHGFAEPGFAAAEFLTARIVMNREIPPSRETEAYEREFAARYGRFVGELVRRLEAEPGVADVTFASRPLGEPLPAGIEIEGVPAPLESPSGHRTRVNRVDVGFFEAFDVPILAGRDFRPGDVGAAATPVIVSLTFVEQVLGGRNAIGRRFRYVEKYQSRSDGEDVEPARWYEIVGVVSDVLTVGVYPGETEVRLYHPTALGQVYPVSLALQMRGAAPAGFAPRLREIAAAVDPTLRLNEVQSLDGVLRQLQGILRLVALAMTLVTLSVLLLSAAGNYALMSFTVARRRKEIGIRAALGARPHHLVASIFSRALGQLAIGIAIGIGAAALLNNFTGGNLMGGEGAVVLPGVAALMMVVGILAVLVPARRGLRIHPTEALRAE